MNADTGRRRRSPHPLRLVTIMDGAGFNALESEVADDLEAILDAFILRLKVLKDHRLLGSPHLHGATRLPAHCSHGRAPARYHQLPPGHLGLHCSVPPALESDKD